MSYLTAILHLRPGAQVAVVGGDTYDHIDWGQEVPIPKADLDAAMPAAEAAALKRADAAKAKAELAAIDLASIRAIREYIVSKPDAPPILKDREAAAVAARAKLAGV